MLRAENIKIAYDLPSGKSRTVLTDFSFSANGGELIGLIGANGSGKSSMLRVLAGLQKTNGGELFWNDAAIGSIALSGRPQIMASLFRNFGRPDGLTVSDLAQLGRQPFSGIFGRLSERDHAIADNALERVGMAAFAHRKLGTLSDGEFQKAMLAKMLAQDCPIMLLDEPTTHLDLPSSIEFLKLLRVLSRTENKTIILSSHNIGVLFKLVDQIIVLSLDGKHQSGSPDAIANTVLVKQFLRNPELSFNGVDLSFNPKL